MGGAVLVGVVVISACLASIFVYPLLYLIFLGIFQFSPSESAFVEWGLLIISTSLVFGFILQRFDR